MGRPRLPSPERKRRRQERAKAWHLRNPELKKAADLAYQAQPGYLERRRTAYADARRRKIEGGHVPQRGRPRLPDDVGSPALVRARHNYRAYRARLKELKRVRLVEIENERSIN